MEQEVMKTVLQEILQELNSQRVQLSHLLDRWEALNKTSIGIEQKLSQSDLVPFALSKEQEALMKKWINEHFEALQAEIKKHPIIHTTHKHISLIPPSFRIEHFPLLVNTIMKWVVVLMVLLFTMWQVVGIIK